MYKMGGVVCRLIDSEDDELRTNYNYVFTIMKNVTPVFILIPKDLFHHPIRMELHYIPISLTNTQVKYGLVYHMANG